MKIVTKLLLIMLITSLLCSSAEATYDDAVFGKYSYTGSDMSISFEWTPDALEGLVINGVRYGKEVKLVPNGMQGLFYSYDAIIRPVKADGLKRIIHLDLLTKSNNDVASVAGIYIEMSSDEKVKRMSMFSPHLIKRR